MSDSNNTDSANVIDLLSHLPKLSTVVERIDELIETGRKRNDIRHVEANIIPGMDIPIRIEAKSIYIDNLHNANAITLQFDNEIAAYMVPAGTGQFIPCLGNQQFRINGQVSPGSIVNAILTTREITYDAPITQQSMPYQINAVQRVLAYATDTPIADSQVLTTPTIDAMLFHSATFRIFGDVGYTYQTEQSDDGVTWETSAALGSNGGVTMSTLQIYLRYIRIAVSGGLDPQTVFRFSVYLSPM